MPGLQPGCCIHPLCTAVGLSALSIIKNHQPAPVAGCTSLIIYTSQMVQKALQGTDASSDTDTSCSPSASRHGLWLNYPFSPFLQAALSHKENIAAPWKPPALHHPYHPLPILKPECFELLSQLLLHPSWQIAKHTSRGPSLCPLHLPAHPSLLTCCCSPPPPFHSSVFANYSSVFFFL